MHKERDSQIANTSLRTVVKFPCLSVVDFHTFLMELNSQKNSRGFWELGPAQFPGRCFKTACDDLSRNLNLMDQYCSIIQSVAGFKLWIRSSASVSIPLHRSRVIAVLDVITSFATILSAAVSFVIVSAPPFFCFCTFSGMDSSFDLVYQHNYRSGLLYFVCLHLSHVLLSASNLFWISLNLLFAVVSVDYQRHFYFGFLCFIFLRQFCLTRSPISIYFLYLGCRFFWRSFLLW